MVNWMKSTVFVTLLSLAVLPGCYNTARNAATPSRACMEAESVVIENNTNETVEVFADRAGYGQVPLGPARTGRSTIKLPPNSPSKGTSISALGVSGMWRQVTYGAGPMAGKVWASIQCPPG